MKKYINKIQRNKYVDAEKLTKAVRFSTVRDGITTGRKGFYLVVDGIEVKIERPEIFESEYEELK